MDGPSTSYFSRDWTMLPSGQLRVSSFHPGTTVLPRIANSPHSSKFRLRSDGSPGPGMFITTDVATIFMAQADTPLQLQVQIVDGGASRFINANRHEFHTYTDLPPSVVLLSGASRLTAQLWHRRLGHIHHDGICNTISRSTGIPGSLSKAEFCTPCAIAKSSVAARCRDPGSRH
mmetsp:Transcript_12208/g.21922  ORF Transcript_12208/g.21922 Transcript_12208/m.21922 type:complete len:175 (-) Transcript_12208:2270-2794(-)